MYFNKLKGVFILDVVDFLLISCLIGSILASYLKNSFSEKSKMTKLKNDLIQKSRLINSSNSSHLFRSPKSNLKQLKLSKINKMGLDSRGGANYEYQLAEKVKEIVLAAFLKKKELTAIVFKVLFTKSSLVLQFILAMCNINMDVLVLDPVRPQIIVIACCTGGTVGFVVSWISVGAILLTPPTILSVLLVRSVAQQIRYNAQYIKFKPILDSFLMKNKFQDSLKDQKVEGLKFEDLNWNKNPAIKEAAERLGIFENPPSLNRSHKFETLDPDSDLRKMLEDLGLIKATNNKARIKIKSPLKSKLVKFSDFIEGIIDGENKSELNVMDAEIVEVVKEPLRIRIKD
jgi:hypothetical protein